MEQDHDSRLRFNLISVHVVTSCIALEARAWKVGQLARQGGEDG